MIDQATRTAILHLREKGHGFRTIAKALGLARQTVRDVIEDGRVEVPVLQRGEKGTEHRDEILAMYGSCKGNLVRVHENLRAMNVDISYQALTAFCRRHGIGHEPPKPAGRYDFAPGEEMQHDTSPHDVKFRGVLRRVQTASVVLCYSRMIFQQAYPRFTRFECKVFLTKALRYFDGACPRCMVDNTHVVAASGTGANMVPAPEMAAFGARLGFHFEAHELGDANRSARVELGFDYIENNFHAGRDFDDWAHLNREAVSWCDKVNAKYSDKLKASRRELFVVEKPRLKALPMWIPDVYALHHRIVDVYGFVNLHTNRYSVPYTLIGRPVEVRETEDQVLIFEGPRQVAEHPRFVDAASAHVARPEHRPRRGERSLDAVLGDEEKALLAAAPEFADYIAALKKRSLGRGTLALRRFQRLVDDYPRAPLADAVSAAAEYGLYDLDRLERMVLRSIAKDYFLVPKRGRDDDPEEPDDG
jgi:transposase